jgi:hypothetical protein
MRSLIESRAEVMTAFLEYIDDKYGSAEECAKQLFGLDDEDVGKIRKNLASA